MFCSRAACASGKHCRVEVPDSQYRAVRACASARLLHGVSATGWNYLATACETGAYTFETLT